MNTQKILVVGGGPAAHRFVEAMAARGLDGFTVTVLTEETWLPYDRVALSQALLDDVDLTLGEPTMWDHPAITLATGSRAVSLDREARTVTTEAGEIHAYDQLVLATGSNAARLPFPGMDAAHVYRTVDDVRTLRAEVTRLTEEYGRTIDAVVIGGGLLGLEAAGGMQSLGAKAAVINGAPWLMNTQLDEGAGQALDRLITAKGLTVHGGVFPSEFVVEDGRMTGVDMADGRRIPADLVVVAIGVRARDELPRDAGMTMGPRGGVVIDDACATE
ncbi:MAG: NAD(P)/FAD-dependent oxidoreductase, partial [Actinomycetes bacterium]